MPVDLVLAISHNRLVREREWKRQKIEKLQQQQRQQQDQQEKQEQQEQINKKLIGIGYYDTIGKDNDKNKNKDKICFELFKIW
jgi:anthranilate/para-aminobenzoate synthase component I